LVETSYPTGKNIGQRISLATVSFRVTSGIVLVVAVSESWFLDRSESDCSVHLSEKKKLPLRRIGLDQGFDGGCIILQHLLNKSTPVPIENNGRDLFN
jgi:hypothetical protein